MDGQLVDNVREKQQRDVVLDQSIAVAIRRFLRLTSVVAAVVLPSMWLGAAATLVRAQITVAESGDWRIEYDPSTGALRDWGVVEDDGFLDHLAEHSLHYRIVTDPNEVNINTLTLNEISNPTANQILIDYGDDASGDPFNITILYEINAPPLGHHAHRLQSIVTETVTFTNFDFEPLELAAFAYLDLELNGSAENDLAFPTAANTIRQYSGGMFGRTVDARIISGQNPNAIALEDDPDNLPPFSILASLQDGFQTTLGAPFNTGITGFGDVEQAFQFDLTIGSGESQTIVGQLDGAFFNNDGGSEEFPFIVPQEPDGSFLFPAAAGPGAWYDPPLASGFAYEVETESSPDSRFTHFGAPTGINSAEDIFDIVVDGSVIGQIAGGEVFNFVDQLGDGVTRFEVHGITPSVDVESDNGSPFPSFLAFNQSEGNSFRVAPLTELPGDFSGNDSVENADLTLLLNHWAQSIPPTPAGWLGLPLTAPAIDNDELTALLNNWGTTIGSGSADTVSSLKSVPEPETIAMIFLAACAGGARRNQTGRRRPFVATNGRRLFTVRELSSKPWASND